MYDIYSLQRKIRKEGVDSAISFLTSPDLPVSIKKILTEYNVFIDGYINLSLIYSLQAVNVE